jgi:dUTP pyrophosphatase
MQILKFKKTDPKAIIPRRQTEGAAGFDLHALESEYLHKTTTPLMVRTGISVEIPPGHVGLIRDRSGLAAKHGITVLAGVIDADYRGFAIFSSDCEFQQKKGQYSQR